MKNHILIKVFPKCGDSWADKGEVFDFAFEELPKKIALPEGAPYNGYGFFFSTDGKGGYEFTPDAAEMFIRFNEQKVGRLIEFFESKQYLLLFLSYKGDKNEKIAEDLRP